MLFKIFVNIGVGCDPPQKPNKVPNSAVWKGGCDGGNWIELVSVEKEKIRFRIYRDWNGKLILDADFEYNIASDKYLNIISIYGAVNLIVNENKNELLGVTINWSEFLKNVDVLASPKTSVSDPITDKIVSNLGNVFIK